MCIAQAIDVFATGLVAGVFVMGTFAVLPAASRLEGPAHVLLRQHLIGRLSRFMPPLMLFPIAASVGALALCPSSVSFTFDMLGCALSLAMIGVTVAVNGPLSRRVGTWNPDALPRDWQRDIRRWNIAHSMRMVAAVGAFACAIVGGG